MARETAQLQVEGMSCSHCVSAVKKALDEISGVSSVSVSIDEGIVAVDYDSTAVSLDKIKETITETGYDVV